MQRQRQSTTWGVSLGMERQGKGWHWCTRLRHWGASHLMRRPHVPALTRGRRSDGPWIQRRAPTPTSALAYVTSQQGPGWALALHSAMPY